VTSKNPRVIRAIIKGILSSQTLKQEIGRKFAFYLGLDPGSAGPDGGVDGSSSVNGKTIYFQSRLSKNKLGAEFVDSLYGKAVRHKAQIIVVLAGIGYTSPTNNNSTTGFMNRLQEFDDINRFTIHLLTLRDIFEDTEAFRDAVVDLPPLRQLSREVCEMEFQ